MIIGEISLKVKKCSLLLRSPEVDFSVLYLLTPDCPGKWNCPQISRWFIVGAFGTVTECSRSERVQMNYWKYKLWYWVTHKHQGQNCRSHTLVGIQKSHGCSQISVLGIVTLTFRHRHFGPSWHRLILASGHTDPAYVWVEYRPAEKFHKKHLQNLKCKVLGDRTLKQNLGIWFVPAMGSPGKSHQPVRSPHQRSH